jgi:NADH:ubiquinone oxidoreductase subunit C
MTAVGWLPAPTEELFGTEATAEESYELLTVDVPPTAWLAALRTARDDLGCTYFDWLSAVDEPGTGFRVSAHVVALSPVRRLLVRTTVPHETPVLPTAVDVYAGAAWHERETHEMFGVDFEGHPALDHLLLPETFEGHPLRKDFVLAARVAKAWPGAKEPGESDHGGPKRRQMLPPGVPDPNEWGPLKGQLPAPPARPNRPARGATRAGGERPARAAGAAGTAGPAGERPVRGTDDRPERATGERPAGAAGERPVQAATDRPEQAVGDRPVRRTRSTSEGSEGSEGSASQAARAENAVPSTERVARSVGGGFVVPSAGGQARSVGGDSVAPSAGGQVQSAGGDSVVPSAEEQGPASAQEGSTAQPPTASRSADAPWHNARPAFDESEPEPEPEDELRRSPAKRLADVPSAEAEATATESEAPPTEPNSPAAAPDSPAPEPDVEATAPDPAAVEEPDSPPVPDAHSSQAPTPQGPAHGTPDAPGTPHAPETPAGGSQ